MKYIAYCRKSTDEKTKQVLSIDSQITELQEYAKKESLQITKIITESKTAKIPGREKFALLLQKIEQGQANGIIAWHPDRLARNSIDGGKIIYLLDTGRLKDLKFPTFWFDNTPQGKFMLSIAFGQSKYYVDNLAENVKRGMRYKVKKGVFPGKAPLGYINEAILRTIAIDPKTFKIVKKAFKLFSQGDKSFTDIAKYLHKFEIEKKNGKPIGVSQVKYMLTNKFYVGIITYKGEQHKGTHKCFISKQLFDKVQKVVKRRNKPRKTGHNFPFCGLVACGECGASITAEKHSKLIKSTRDKATYIYYRCTKKIKPCSQKYIRQLELQKQLRKYIKQCGLHPDWKPYFDKWIKQDYQKEQQTTALELEKLNISLNKLEVKTKKLLDTYLDELIDPQTYKQKQNELFEKKAKIEEQIAILNNKGLVWLEPMKNFLNLALQARKIARAKNNPDELAAVGRKVGSNYSLKDRRLTATINFPWRMLAEMGGSASRSPSKSSIFQMVTP
jgi:site-specific DNA recombinase